MFVRQLQRIPNITISLFRSKKLHLKHIRSAKHFHSNFPMGDPQLQFLGLPLSDAIKRLEDFAPTSLAESWDNVGLLVDPMELKPITCALLTNDLTEDVMEEAIQAGVELIISYHPPLFKPLKSITSRTWKERILVSCLKNKIAIYSPHTSWDIVQGGINDWLADGFSIDAIREPLTETGAGRLCKLVKPEPLKSLIDKIKVHIGIPHLRLAKGRGKSLDSVVSTVALCAGSGASVLNGVNAELYLTGEMLHHDVLDATHRGSHVILCNHSDSERGFLFKFAEKLQNEIFEKKIKVMNSKLDSDPLKTV